MWAFLVKDINFQTICTIPLKNFSRKHAHCMGQVQDKMILNQDAFVLVASVPGLVRGQVFFPLTLEDFYKYSNLSVQGYWAFGEIQTSNQCLGFPSILSGFLHWTPFLTVILSEFIRQYYSGGLHHLSVDTTSVVA